LVDSVLLDIFDTHSKHPLVLVQSVLSCKLTFLLQRQNLTSTLVTTISAGLSVITVYNLLKEEEEHEEEEEGEE
jgi:hypothetical protein